MTIVTRRSLKMDKSEKGKYANGNSETGHLDKINYEKHNLKTDKYEKKPSEQGQF